MGWAEEGGVPILLFLLPPPFPSLLDHLAKKKKYYVLFPS